MKNRVLLSFSVLKEKVHTFTKAGVASGGIAAREILSGFSFITF